MKDSKHQYKYALRRVQRAGNSIQNDKFLNEVLKGDSKIFDEIRKFRGKVKKCSSTMDGEVGPKNIADHFAGIYSQLYNQGDKEEELSSLQERLNRKICNTDWYDVNRITEDVVKQTLHRMKGNKNDSVYDF